jgi:hypothetical protein
MPAGRKFNRGVRVPEPRRGEIATNSIKLSTSILSAAADTEQLYTVSDDAEGSCNRVPEWRSGGVKAALVKENRGRVPNQLVTNQLRSESVSEKRIRGLRGTLIAVHCLLQTLIRIYFALSERS